MVVKVGDKIKRLREEAGLTQSELAKKLGKTQSYVGLLEKDYRSITLNTLEKIAKALKKDTKDFL